jgi:hypothetical protein
MGEGEAEIEKCPVDIFPAERVHREVHPGLQMMQDCIMQKRVGVKSETRNINDLSCCIFPSPLPPPTRGGGNIF